MGVRLLTGDEIDLVLGSFGQFDEPFTVPASPAVDAGTASAAVTTVMAPVPKKRCHDTVVLGGVTDDALAEVATFLADGRWNDLLPQGQPSLDPDFSAKQLPEAARVLGFGPPSDHPRNAPQPNHDARPPPQPKAQPQLQPARAQPHVMEPDQPRPKKQRLLNVVSAAAAAVTAAAPAVVTPSIGAVPALKRVATPTELSPVGPNNVPPTSSLGFFAFQHHPTSMIANLVQPC